MSQQVTSSAPRRLSALAALSLIGMGVSVYLTQHFYEVRNGTAGFQSLCNLGQKMNCDAVAASTFAELLPGVPLSSVAAGAFIALFIASVAARNPFWRRESLRFAFVLSAIGALFSLAYFAVMAGVLKTFCLFCLVTDVLAISSFGIVLSLKPEGLSQHRLDVPKWKTLGSFAAASLLVAVLGLRVLDASAEGTATIEERAQSVLATTPVSVNAGPEFPSLGAPDAPITIVEFSDFQCPFCRLGAFTVNSVLERFPGKVRVVFRNYPLDSQCNRKLERPMHPYACEAARASYCAHKQGKFEPVYESFFQNQASFATGRVIQMAQEAGADMTALSACMSTDESRLAVMRDIEEGNNLGVISTPTFFVNGRKTEGVLPPAAWNRVVEELLKRGSK